MGIAVNGVDISDAAIEQEFTHHQDDVNPLKRTVEELVLRTLLLQEATRLNIAGASDEERIEQLFAQEVVVPQVDDAACEMYYRNHQAEFTQGDLVEARHILFQVTPTVALELLRETGELVLDALRTAPQRFAELARQYSNCPSGQVGGSLGQIGRGDTVPEFEKLLFRLAPGELASHLLETRFGLHIVQLDRRIEGKVLPLEAVRAQIGEYLNRSSWQRALHQYLHILVGRADIAGITLEGSNGALVQ